MLTITISGNQYWDEDNEVFVYPETVELQLEHSLVSLSKWESIYEKPFLVKDEKTSDEVVGYIQAMIMTPGIDPNIVNSFSKENFEEVNAYIDRKMTATWFNEPKTPQRTTETITSELIYYWMNVFGIPIECETWNLSRLFALIKIHNAKNQKPKKMGRSEIAARQRELNEKRRAQYGTSG